MRLRDLFSDDAKIDTDAEAAVVTGLAVDSRAVKPGDLFFALAGSKTDGARFIDSAIASGAVAIAGDHSPRGFSRVPFVATPNPRRALALAAAKFYPRQPATIAAVTGTSGKTSVAAFARQIWQRLGHASASIGTIGLVSPKRTIYGSLTTPDPVALHRQLDEIAREGVTHLAFEASSHGLDQYRLDGVRMAAGGFTNLSRDHMDYHPDVAHYLAAKLRLFRDLVAADGAAVISADHDCSHAVIDVARARTLRIVAVGKKGEGAGEGIRLIEADIHGFAQKLNLEHRGRRHAVRLPLVGEFQIENALVSAGLAIGTGSEPKAVFAALEHLEGAKGVAVERGDEDDRRRSGALQRAEDTEPVEARHLDVEEDQIGTRAPDRLYRLKPVLALRHDFDVLIVAKLLANPLPRQRLVIDDDGPDRTRPFPQGQRAGHVDRALLVLGTCRGAAMFLLAKHRASSGFVDRNPVNRIGLSNTPSSIPTAGKSR